MSTCPRPMILHKIKLSPWPWSWDLHKASSSRTQQTSEVGGDDGLVEQREARIYRAHQDQYPLFSKGWHSLTVLKPVRCCNWLNQSLKPFSFVFWKGSSSYREGICFDWGALAFPDFNRYLSSEGGIKGIIYITSSTHWKSTPSPHQLSFHLYPAQVTHSDDVPTASEANCNIPITIILISKLGVSWWKAVHPCNEISVIFSKYGRWFGKKLWVFFFCLSRYRGGSMQGPWLQMQCEKCHLPMKCSRRNEPMWRGRDWTEDTGWVMRGSKQHHYHLQLTHPSRPSTTYYLFVSWIW